MGSLVAAAASWLDARARRGRWLVRIEDIDGPREIPGSADAILAALDALGFHWNGEVVRQSARDAHYRAAFERLVGAGLAYPCGCSRREIEEAGDRNTAAIYPGTCRDGLPAGRTARAWRLRVPDRPISFDDRALGTMTQNLAREVGDFVIRRADGVWAYQLAVVVDDAAQGVTDVVRGADLVDSTLRQHWLQQALDYPTPATLHVPLVLDAEGRKLSKQERATPIDPSRPLPSLLSAAHHLELEVGAVKTKEAAALQILDLAKASGTTILFTSLLGSAAPLTEQTQIAISTIADTWMHVSNVVQGGERNRALTIIKSRGMGHSNQVRELVLTDEGITLADVYTVGGEVLMGTLRWEKENADRRARESAKNDAFLRERRAELALADTRAKMATLAQEQTIQERELRQIQERAIAESDTREVEERQLLLRRRADQTTPSDRPVPEEPTVGRP